MEQLEGKSKRMKVDKSDKDYFSAYADLNIHEEMIRDKVRTNAYRLAILKNYDKIRGKVVADIGAGTGILSMFCVQAGAKKVYAVEASNVAHMTIDVIKSNKMQEKVTIVHGSVESVELPEKVDVIVSEWMGYCLLYETMLPSVLLARDKWLKQGGLMLPETAKMYIAPFTYHEDDEERCSFWQGVYDMYKVDMAVLTEHEEKKRSTHMQVYAVLPENIQALGAELCCLDLYSLSVEELHNVQTKFKLKCFGHSKIHAFVCWFDVLFRQHIKLSTSPYSQSTHWEQSIIHLNEVHDVVQDTSIEGILQIKQHSENRRFLEVQLEYRVGDGKKNIQQMVMNGT